MSLEFRVGLCRFFLYTVDVFINRASDFRIEGFVATGFEGLRGRPRFCGFGFQVQGSGLGVD